MLFEDGVPPAVGGATDEPRPAGATVLTGDALELGRVGARLQLGRGAAAETARGSAAEAEAEARAEDRGDELHWWQHGEPIDAPAAGTGIAATLVDLALGAAVAADPAAQGARERAIPVDQTNVSVIVDERWVVKIVREWGGADRAADILTRLDRAGVGVTAALGGTVEWRHPEHGATTVALVTEYVPGSEDGWEWAVADVVDHLAGARAAAGTGSAAAPEPQWPAVLGRLTARMHEALVVGGHGAEAAELADARVDRRARALALLERVFAEAAPADSADARDPADVRLASRRKALAAAIGSIPEVGGEAKAGVGGATATAAVRVLPHGDYHVGQVLRTREGRYVVLDFDGDPQWSAERRFSVDGPELDIAHMLTSIDLVAAVVQRRMGGADPLAWEWADTARRQFLAAYDAAVPEGFVDRRALDGLIAEQLLAEIAYARTYLPRWRYAPDGVITHRYPATSGPLPHDSDHPNPQEEPWNPPAS